MSLPELKRRGYAERLAIGSLAGSGTLGLLIPPSIIMIVYGVAAEVRSRGCSSPASCPASCWRSCSAGYLDALGAAQSRPDPAAEPPMTLSGRSCSASRRLIPVVLLIAAVHRLDLQPASPRPPRRPRWAWSARWCSPAVQGALDWASFKAALMGGDAPLLHDRASSSPGAAFLTLAMGFIGLPRDLAEWIGALGLSPYMLLVALTLFFILLGCFLDGISMVVLTMSRDPAARCRRPAST